MSTLVRGAEVPTTGKTNERPGTRAVARHVRMSASKARVVLDLIRGLGVEVNRGGITGSLKVDQGNLVKANDTDLVTALMAAHPDRTLESSALEVLPQLKGAFCLVFMDESGLLIRLDASGNVLWQRTYGGSGNDLIDGVADGLEVLQIAHAQSRIIHVDRIGLLVVAEPVFQASLGRSRGLGKRLAAAAIEPDWVAGISIGAINAAIIAGNPPERRVRRLI